MRVVVTGARGRLGSAIVDACAGVHDAIALARRDLDIMDAAAVASTIDRIAPDVIVNAAALAGVDDAEEHPVDALNVNAFGVQALAHEAGRRGAMFVHYSTDFVFDGTASMPYRETDATNPQSVYGISKRIGEWFATDAPRAYVLRVETLFGPSAHGAKSKGSVATIVDALKAGESPKVFTDRTISPTYVPDAARATMRLIESSPPPGIYHCVNTGRCTWHEFAVELARCLGVEPRLTPIRFADTPPPG
ncbi:MAG TPA: NAD(P)-dependent oxidoreductase, partial [Vicinamibacterales bacterium]|nr:NAD(P)-dependent oxidoreductase [Vicinamibacterales bacterium]